MNPSLESRSNLIWLICLAGFAMVALNALRAMPQVSDLLLQADGDDQMRLVQVRDWLAGQGWFDIRQYRVLPPDGIPMHWSRYVDAGIAAVLTAASWVFAPAEATLATVILWPSLLAGLMVLVLAQGTARLFGPAAAIGALAVFFSWGKLGGEFVAPRIDHHNLQLLCGTALFYLALVPGRAAVLGALGGLATALSLAIGLEMLPFLALIWALMALRHAVGEPQAGPWLAGFCAAFALSAPLLLAGQTAPADWATPHCDVLATPVLALGAVGIVATLTPVLAGRLFTGPLARLLVLGTLSALGLWLAAPLLGPCLAGPYADVPPDVVRIIESNVSEALSAPTLLKTNPALMARVLLPPALLALLALATTLWLWSRLTRIQAVAMVQALLVVAAGGAVALMQIRAANLMAPAVPLLAGVLVHAFTLIPRKSPLRLPAAAVLVLALPSVVEQGASAALGLGRAPVAALATGGPSASDCRSATAMAELATLPPSILFSSLNLGPTILAYTPHAVTSAAYHRSPTAFWNGVGAFASLPDLRGAVRASAADYLVLCPGAAIDRTLPAAAEILDGKGPDWLRDVTGTRTELRVYQVDRAALGHGTGS